MEVLEAKCRQTKKKGSVKYLLCFQLHAELQGLLKDPRGKRKIKYGSAWCVPHICPLHMEVSTDIMREVERNTAREEKKMWHLLRNSVK